MIFKTQDSVRFSILISLWAVFSLSFVSASQAEEGRFGQGQAVIVDTPGGKSVLFHVEIARTPQQQAQGLMNRTALAENAGMLFVFEKPEVRHFWMKNTLIPLDMLFIGPGGRINHIHHMARPLDLTGVSSVFPAEMVLEINGGAADRFGIAEGARVHVAEITPRAPD